MVNTDNKVFQQIQTATTDSPFGKGTIIFANNHTGAPVEMHQKVREVLTSEDLFMGNNPIIQLQKALERLEKGPWYIDCRGDVLYIHNRPFNIPSVHNYVYAKENGEVLSISFKTQYRTKNAPRAAALSFDSFSKRLNISSTGTTIGSDQEIADQAAKIRKEANEPSIGQNVSNSYLTPDVTSERGYWESKRWNGGSVDPKVIQAETDMEFIKAQGEDYRALKDNLSDYGTYNNLIHSYLNGRGMNQESQSGQYLDQKLNELKDDPDKLDSFLREQFGRDSFTVVNDLYRPFVETLDLSELVPSTCYIPAYNNRHQRISTSYVYQNNSAGQITDGDFAYSVEQFLKSKGYVLVASPQYSIRYNRYNDVKVTRVTKKKGDYTISGYRLMSDYLSRKLNSPVGQYQRYLLNHAMANTTRKITEARLEIEMRVVGRPSLTSGTKIHIENVGSRSGDYIIKTCIHRLSSDGYTCSLTLTRGSYKTAATTDTVSIDVGKSKGVDNSNTSPTPNRTPVNNTEFKVIPTQEELEYFEQFKGNISKQTDIATEITWHRYKAWKSGNLAKAQEKGVYHKHISIDSEGNVKKVTWTQTPASHDGNYQDFKTLYSKKYYQDIKKKNADYQRYHKK